MGTLADMMGDDLTWTERMAKRHEGAGTERPISSGGQQEHESGQSWDLAQQKESVGIDPNEDSLFLDLNNNGVDDRVERARGTLGEMTEEQAKLAREFLAANEEKTDPKTDPESWRATDTGESPENLDPSGNNERTSTDPNPRTDAANAEYQTRNERRSARSGGGGGRRDTGLGQVALRLATNPLTVFLAAVGGAAYYFFG